MTREEFDKVASIFLRNGFVQDRIYNLDHKKPSLHMPRNKKHYLSFDGYNFRVIEGFGELKNFTNNLSEHQINTIIHFFRYTENNKENYRHIIEQL